MCTWQHPLSNEGNCNTPHMVSCSDMWEGGGGGSQGAQRDGDSLSSFTRTTPSSPYTSSPSLQLFDVCKHGEVIIKRTSVILLGMQLELYTIVMNHYNSRRSSSCI